MYVERKEYDDLCKNSNYIIEPTESFRERYPLQMANVLVDINREVTSKVRVLNPFPTAVSIKQDAVIGQAEVIANVQAVLTKQETTDTTEAIDNTSIRRVKFENIRNIAEQPSQLEPAESTVIPDHLLGACLIGFASPVSIACSAKFVNPISQSCFEKLSWNRMRVSAKICFSRSE